MITQPATLYDDFAEFIAGLSPDKVLAYNAPERVQQRVEYLVEQKKIGRISTAESSELDQYFLFEHIVRLAKTRALKLINLSSAAA